MASGRGRELTSSKIIRHLTQTANLSLAQTTAELSQHFLNGQLQIMRAVAQFNVSLPSSILTRTQAMRDQWLVISHESIASITRSLLSKQVEATKRMEVERKKRDAIEAAKKVEAERSKREAIAKHEQDHPPVLPAGGMQIVDNVFSSDASHRTPSKKFDNSNRLITSDDSEVTLHAPIVLPPTLEDALHAKRYQLSRAAAPQTSTAKTETGAAAVKEDERENYFAGPNSRMVDHSSAPRQTANWNSRAADFKVVNQTASQKETVIERIRREEADLLQNLRIPVNSGLAHMAAYAMVTSVADREEAIRRQTQAKLAAAEKQQLLVRYGAITPSTPPPAAAAPAATAATATSSTSAAATDGRPRTSSTASVISVGGLRFLGTRSSTGGVELMDLSRGTAATADATAAGAAAAVPTRGRSNSNSNQGS